MSVLVQLYFSFFKIGLFGFGGGYAMISLVQQEITAHAWLTVTEFVDIIAIAEMTPGPIAINSATYVGYKVASLSGSVAATLGVISPSLILVVILAKLLNTFGQSPVVVRLVYLLRPAVIGLILAAAWAIGSHSITNLPSLAIALFVTGLLFLTNIHPILLILFAGIAGIVVF